MPRKAATFRIDERVLEALSVVVKRSGSSRNRWLEMHLLNYLKENGALPPTTEPLGELRGGDQKSAEFKRTRLESKSEDSDND